MANKIKFGIMSTRRGYMYRPTGNLTDYNTAKRTYNKIEDSSKVTKFHDYQVRLVMVNTINDNVVRVLEEKTV
jgi:hypothetical protein